MALHAIELKAAVKYFFDTKAVDNAKDRSIKRALSRLGAFTRTTARSSLRRRKKSSKEGSTPSIHAPSGQFASLKNILFFYDPAEQSVIIGPVKANQKNTHIKNLGTAPETMEYGGSVIVGKKLIRIGPRPFMKPAFEKAKPQAAKAAQNTFY